MYLLVFLEAHQSVERMQCRHGNFLLAVRWEEKKNKMNSEWASGNEYTRPDSCASDLKLVHDERGETPFFLLGGQI